MTGEAKCNCFRHYVHGTVSPFRCPDCKTLWAVRDSQWVIIEPAPCDESDTDQHLALMLHTQRMLQIESFGIDPAEASVEERVAYIRWNVQAVVDELHEVMHETSWKMWTHGEPFINTDEALKEWIDAWHFMMNILWAVTGLGTLGDANVLADVITSEYMAKKQINAERQAAGYPGHVEESTPTET